MKLAIFTMAHNEDHMLDLWCQHYSKFESSSLIVVDHGSDLPLEQHVRGRATILRIPRTGVDENIDTTRAAFASSLQNALIRYFDIVVYTDVDEFLLLDPKLNSDLPSYLARRSDAVIAPIGLNVVHDQSEEGPFDPARSVLCQRRTAVFVEHFCKPIVTKIPIFWGPGFHTSKSVVALDEAIFLFHLNLFDRASKYRRQKQREIIGKIAGKVVAGTWGWREAEIEKQYRFFLDMPSAPLNQNFDFAEVAGEFRKSSVPGPDGFYVNRQRRGPWKHKIPERFSDLL
jgi:Glycosyl transferase family 2